MTIRAVVDTHAAIWYIFDDPRLSSIARVEMDMAAATGQQIAVSSISLLEMVYLVDKGRIAATAIHLGVPLISRDSKIRSSSVPTIW